MTRTIAACFDSLQDAERAAFNLAKRAPGMRGEVCDARSDRQRPERLALPMEDVATLHEGFRRGSNILHADTPLPTDGTGEAGTAGAFGDQGRDIRADRGTDHRRGRETGGTRPRPLSTQ